MYPSFTRLHLENWCWGICTFCTLVIFLPLTVLYRAPQDNFGIAIVLLLGVGYSGTRLAFLALRGHNKLLSLTFWLFAYIWLGLAPLAQVSTGRFPWPSAYPEHVLIYSATIILVGYASYDLGSWLANRYLYNSKIQLIPYSLFISKYRVYILSFLAFPIAILSLIKVGGFHVVFSTRAAYEQMLVLTLTKAGLLIWNALLRVPASIALVLAWFVWINRKQFSVRGWQSIWHLGLLLSLLALNLVVNNPLSNSRYLLGTIALGIAFMTFGWNKRRSLGVWIMVLLLAFLLIFPYADIFRSEYEDLRFQPVATQLATNADFDCFQQVANTVVYVTNYGLTGGRQLLGAVLFWVPRSIWLDKPMGSGQLVAQQFGYGYTNLSSPLWAEAYINAGIIGLIVVLLLYGVVTSLLQNAYIASYKQKPSLIAALVPILAAYQIFFLRGDLINGVALLAPVMAYFLVASRVVLKNP